ncbi:MAG TPA: choice-of-anchor tandem repeat GloVer-containing protein, partial [Chthonomonadales bacterium]|nr:choice-of-anchor tandem repeat GloVer-containing protein [Chthonomonadales bacterium]
SFSVVHAIAAVNSSGAYTEGNSPYSLVADADGNLYGTTLSGGTDNQGVIFKLTTGGTYTVLYSLLGSDGFLPKKLVQGGTGILYGVCYIGGDGSNGTVFSITTAGAFQLIHSFSSSGAEGASPQDLAFMPGGTVYGICSHGGANNAGSIFSIDPGITFTLLYSFPPVGAGPNGANPTALVAASDGNLYGAASAGGQSNTGALFRATPAGAVTTEYSFSALSTSAPYSNADGADPVTILQAENGNTYGMAAQGGAYGSGAAYKLVTVNRTDVDLDNTPDLFFQSQSTGALGFWTMSSAVKIGGGQFAPSNPGSPSWKLVGTGDFDGDSRMDLLFQNSSTGNLGYWLMNGPTQTSAGAISPTNPGSGNWRVASVVDLNGDFSPDIVFQNTQTGEIGYWLMNGTTRVASGLFSPANPGAMGWKLMAAVHNYNTGNTILYWQYTPTGAAAYWVVNSSQSLIISGSLSPSSPGAAGWAISGISDVTGAGRADVIWQYQPTGGVAFWLMNGSAQISAGAFSPASPGSADWQLVGER